MTSIWTPPSAPRTPSRPRLVCTSSPHDAALIAILDESLAPDETVMAGFARKEAALRAVFAALPLIDARSLHARLAHVRTGDVLAERFMRLVVERRTRLLAFLADAPRRAAIR